MKKSLFILGSIAVTLFANEPMLPSTPYEKIHSLMDNNQSYFLEVGSEHCRSCQKMGKLLYKMKEAHPKSNLFFVDIQKQREVASRLKIQMIPTQLIFDSNNSEVYRHVGVLSQEEMEEVMSKFKVSK